MGPVQATRSPGSERVRPLEALRAIRALVRNPDDTARVFDVIDALSGKMRGRLFERFRHTETGQRLLEQRPDLLTALSERSRLLSLPPGTLGRAYGEFMTREQISADGLVDASSQVWRRNDVPEQGLWFANRLRDMHDLWHVVAGYQRDLIGEASLLAFTYAQTRNPGIGFIVAVAYWRAGRVNRAARSLMREGYRRGSRAAWLPAQDWEALLERPLDQVREELRVGQPPVYEQLRSEGAPALAA